MSENKHTPEPWEYWENDRTGFGVKMPRKKKTRFGAEPYAVIGGFEQEDRAEMKANARRIVACVNACAGCATEVLETAPVGFFNSTYGHPKYLEEITKQRDELLAAMNKLSGMKLNMVADGIVDKAIARAKKNLCGDSTNMVETSVPAIVFYPAGSLGEEVQP